MNDRGKESRHMAMPVHIGRYPIIRELGRGGMGVVYLARDPTLERAVAIKVLPADLAHDPVRLQRFEREARLLAAVSHPNIRVIHSLEREDNGSAFLVLELVDGTDLRDRLQEGPLPWKEALTLAVQVAAALEAAHARGVVHRDLKPANVLITADQVVKLVDFGLARREGVQADVTSLTGIGDIIGTPGYMSPEQVRGETLDRRTDIFTFGCLLFECLCGRKAFSGESVVACIAAVLHGEPDWAALPAGIPPTIVAILRRCLDKDAETRLQQIGEVRLELESLLFPSGLDAPRSTFSSAIPPGPGHNLPRRLTSFVGRAEALAEIGEMLRDRRLLTLTGVGGCGKTRLALRVAEEAVAGFAGGTWLVELAGITDPRMIEPQLAAVLGVAEEKEARVSLRSLLIRRLKAAPALLLLDNCEHLLTATGALAGEFLEQCEGLRVLCTSREALGIPGETTLRVPSLTLPPEDAEAIASVREDAADLGRAASGSAVPPFQGASGPEAVIGASEAVRLFTERARAVQPRFRLTAENAASVARICRRLDGIPLAIELAAAKVRVLSCAEIESRLRDRFRLLAGSGRGALERQRTLRGAIDWSYGLLDGDEQRLFRGLSVFAGGWTLEAAAAVCGDGRDELEVLDLLARLADKSLVQVEEHGGVTRYGYLETIRQYAREESDRAGETMSLLDRHLEFFLALGEEAKPHFLDPSEEDREPWDERLRPERENLLAAFQWCEHAENGAEKGMRLFQAVRSFFWVRDEWTVMRETGAAFLRLGGGPSKIRAEFLVGVAWLRQFTDPPGALALLRESVDQYRGLDDSPGLAMALRGLARVLGDTDSVAAAEPLYAESVQICRMVGDRRGEAEGLLALGDWLCGAERSAEGRPLLAEADRIFRALGRKGDVARVQEAAGRVAQQMDEDSEAACRFYREALAAVNRPGPAQAKHRVRLLGELAQLEMEAGRSDEARKRLDEALRLVPDHGRLGFEWWLLHICACVALRECDLPRARIDGLRALEAAQRSPFVVHAMISALFLSEVAVAEGNPDEARNLCEEVLARARAMGRRSDETSALKNLAVLAGRSGDHVEAIRLSEQAVARARALGKPGDLRTVLATCGLAMAAGGNRAAACRAFLEAVRALPTGRLLPLMEMLEQFAEMAALLDEPERAAGAWGAAQAIRERKGQPLSPYARFLRESVWNRVRKALGPERFDAIHEAGKVPSSEVVRAEVEAWLRNQAGADSPECEGETEDRGGA